MAAFHSVYAYLSTPRGSSEAGDGNIKAKLKPTVFFKRFRTEKFLYGILVLSFLFIDRYSTCRVGKKPHHHYVVLGIGER